MTQTSFTLVGFTQPQAALPIIEDIQNNAKGFTSRVLWLFPEPVYCRMQDSMLTPEESEQLKEFQDQLGKRKQITYTFSENNSIELYISKTDIKNVGNLKWYSAIIALTGKFAKWTIFC